MSKRLEFDKNRLTYGDANKIFPDEILDAVETPFGVVVLFNWDRLPKRNMFLLNDHLVEVWQVEEINSEVKMCPYTSVKFEDGKIKARNGLGFKCEIDPATGKYQNAVFTK
jgi:hypothetical protein